MGIATAKGLYLPDKLNLLLRYWAKPLWRAISKRLNPRYAERLRNQLSRLSNTDVDEARLKLVSKGLGYGGFRFGVDRVDCLERYRVGAHGVGPVSASLTN